MYIQPRYYSVSKNNSQCWVALSPNPHPSEEASDQLCPVDPYLRSRRSPNLQMSLATLPLTSWGHFTPDGRGTHTVPYQGGPASGWHGELVSWPTGLAAHPSRHCWGCGSLGRSHDTEAPVGGGRALGEVEKASTGERTGNGRPGTCG